MRLRDLKLKSNVAFPTFRLFFGIPYARLRDLRLDNNVPFRIFLVLCRAYVRLRVFFIIFPRSVLYLKMLENKNSQNIQSPESDNDVTLVLSDFYFLLLNIAWFSCPVSFSEMNIRYWAILLLDN